MSRFRFDKTFSDYLVHQYLIEQGNKKTAKLLLQEREKQGSGSNPGEVTLSDMLLEIPENKAKKLITLNEVISHAKNTKKFSVSIKKELKRRLVPFHSKTKIPKLSCAQLEDLPDEIILKIFSLLDIKEILKCGQVSQRIRAISNDNSLWLQLNLSHCNVDIPYGFLEKAAENGCIYLGLAFSHLEGGENSKIPLDFKYLVLSQSYKKSNEKVPKGLLKNCHSLQKLAMENLILDFEDIKHIDKNGKTLTILDLGNICWFKDLFLDLGNIGWFEDLLPNFEEEIKAIKKLFKRCVELNELNWSNSCFCYSDFFTAMAQNLTPNILKVDLSSNVLLEDEHVKILIKRCTKITVLDLKYCTSITKDSVDSIATHLKSLEKLDVSNTKVDSTALLQLKSVETLKILCCLDYDGNFGSKQTNKTIEETNNLRKNLPQISINEDCLYIASPIYYDDRRFDGFWEIKADSQELFTEYF